MKNKIKKIVISASFLAIIFSFGIVSTQKMIVKTRGEDGRIDITPEALSKMNLKHLKEACKQYGIDVEWRVDNRLVA